MTETDVELLKDGLLLIDCDAELFTEMKALLREKLSHADISFD